MLEKDKTASIIRERYGSVTFLNEHAYISVKNNWNGNQKDQGFFVDMFAR